MLAHMAARSIGTGTVSFGMVSIPIRLYSASEPSASISFNLLDGKTKTRLKQQYINQAGEIVPRDQMVKGYEFSKDQYVAFTAEELKAMEEQAQRAIEITEFVPAAAVDPVYYDKAYYLGPEKGGEKAYKLLLEAMRQTGRTALAKWAARGKQYLVMIRPAKGGLVMQQLMYADEVRPISEVPVGDADLKDGELKLAVQLIEQIAAEEFRPENYEDEVKKRYHEAIQRKIEGQEITAAPEHPKAQIIDLMEALKASLAARGTGGSASSSGPPAGAPPAGAESEGEEQKATGTEGRPAKRALRLASGPKRKSSR
jgi:DNA end-binding protein Ku